MRLTRRDRMRKTNTAIMIIAIIVFNYAIHFLDYELLENIE